VIYGEKVIDNNLNEIKRVGIKVDLKYDSVKLCIFLVHKDQISSYTMYQIAPNLSIPVQQVNHAIHAKILYAKRTTPSGEKHKMDIENVYSILNSAFFMISGEELT
jgi:hypothetical protein